MENEKKYSLEPLHISTEEFIAPFFAPEETVCFRVFADRPGSPFAGMKLESDAGNLGVVLTQLREHNAHNRGIFFVINFGGHEDKDIKRMNAQFMEIDDLPFEEQLEKIAAFPIEPSIIVKTRKSLHCYWLINKGNTADALSGFRRIQKKLVKQFSADGNCINLSRVFRVPGFNHCKEESIPVECIKFNPELRYSQEVLEKALPELDDEVTPEYPAPVSIPKPERGKKRGARLVGARCDFIKLCTREAMRLPEPLWYGMITNLAGFEGGEEHIHTLSKPHPGYDEEATNKKIDHYFESGTSPMTCRAIADRGYKCKNLGKCKCNSPAGLAFVPLDISKLKELLTKKKVKKESTPAENFILARKFLLDFLFNMDLEFATVFITNNIKEHFGFKNTEVDQLIRYQKQLCKEFEVYKHNEERIQNDGGMKPWYDYDAGGAPIFRPSVLCDYCNERIPALCVAGEFYFYEDGYYQKKTDLTAKRTIRNLMLPHYRTTFQINDTLDQWKMSAEKSVRQININPYLINFKNGIYDAMTGKMQEHSKDILSTIRIHGKYAPEAKCPKFMEFLHEVLPESEHALIQEMIGYCMLPVNKAQKSFVLVGAPHSGKSTLLSTIQDLILGEENCSSVALQKLDERFNGAQLFNKLANLCADLPTKALEDSSTFKKVVGDDYFTVELKFKEPFSMKAVCVLLFSCNDIPSSADHNDAFLRRLIFIRFDTTVPEERRDPNLKNKFAAEVDGIIAWAIEGLQRLMKNKYKFSETDRTRAEMTAYKLNNSSALQFIDECCTMDKDAVSFTEDIYSEYLLFCKRNNAYASSRTKFNKEVRGLAGVRKGEDSTAHRKAWFGFRLNG